MSRKESVWWEKNVVAPSFGDLWLACAAVCIFIPGVLDIVAADAAKKRIPKYASQRSTAYAIKVRPG